MHPSQEELKALMKQNGFGHVDFHNMSGGRGRASCWNQVLK